MVQHFNILGIKKIFYIFRPVKLMIISDRSKNIRDENGRFLNKNMVKYNGYF